MNYPDYLQTDQWKFCRIRALRLAGHHCQICGSVNMLEVHHNSYDHLGQERDDELIVLCDPCHERNKKYINPLPAIWWDAPLREEIAARLLNGGDK